MIAYQVKVVFKFKNKSLSQELYVLPHELATRTRYVKIRNLFIHIIFAK